MGSTSMQHYRNGLLTDRYAGSRTLYLGFQWGSRMSTRVAAVRVRPRPPTCRQEPPYIRFTERSTLKETCSQPAATSATAPHLAGEQEDLFGAIWGLELLHTGLQHRQALRLSLDFWTLIL